MGALDSLYKWQLQTITMTTYEQMLKQNMSPEFYKRMKEFDRQVDRKIDLLNHKLNELGIMILMNTVPEGGEK